MGVIRHARVSYRLSIACSTSERKAEKGQTFWRKT